MVAGRCSEADATIQLITPLLVGMSQWVQGFPLAHGAGSRRLAEVGEGVSEARPAAEA